MRDLVERTIGEQNEQSFGIFKSARELFCEKEDRAAYLKRRAVEDQFRSQPVGVQVAEVSCSAMALVTTESI